MRSVIDALLADNAATGCLSNDVPTMLARFGRQRTAEHCQAVAAEAGRLAVRFGVDQLQATTAGWLHDISAVFPGAEMAAVAEQLALPILPEERRYPPILHQKLSVVLAERLFAVSDPAILSAIGCHTTLRAQAAALDMVVFLADKLAWDQDGPPPFAAAIRVGLDQSLERRALAYLSWLREQRASLAVVHPWLRQAYEWLAKLPWEPAEPIDSGTEWGS